MLWLPVAALGAAIAAPLPSVPPPGGPLRDLEPGKRAEATLKPGELHRYRIAVPGDRPLRFSARQAGIDVVLSLHSPAGAEVAKEDRRSSGEEVLLALVPREGLYELRVAPSTGQAPPGDYSVVVEMPAPGADLRAAFERHLRGRTLTNQGKDRLRDARGEFEAARAIWERLDQKGMAAWSLFEIGRLSDELSEPQAAKDAFQEAARRFAGLGMTGDQAAAQLFAGEALYAQGDHRSASDLWKATLALEKALTPMDRAALRFDYGINLKELGEYEESLASSRMAVEFFQALGKTTEELLARSEVASVHIMRRDPLSALDELNLGLARSREAGRPDMEARLLQRLGLVSWDLGDDDAAAEQWRQALPLLRAAGNRVAEAAVLNLLGDYTARHGDPAEAEAGYRQALDLFRAAGSLEGEARAVTRIGTLLARRGEHARAAEMQEQALRIQRRLGNRQSEILALLNLGRTRASAGDAAVARRTLNEALSLSRGDGAGFAEEEILEALARLDVGEGNLTRALGTLDQIIARSEARQRAALVPALQATIAADAQPWYAARTDLMMRRHQAEPRGGWDARALEAAERARARALLGLLAEARADIRSGVDDDLLARYREAQVALAAAKTETAIADATRQVQLLEAEIRKTSPSYAALTQPVPLNLEAIRGRVIDDDTVLVEYGLGEERSWLWAVTRADFVSAPLPAAAGIESLAQKVHQQLSRRPAAAAGSAATATPAAAAGPGAEADLATLSRTLLGPIADRLATDWRGRRLAIVLPGSLAYVPVGALPPPAGASGEARTGRLIDDHEIVALPSATVLDVLRRESRRRRPATLRIALVGDPVFSSDDPRVRARTASTAAPAGGSPAAASLPGAPPSAASIPGARPAPAADPGTREALAAGGARGFGRLPFSREEVRSIAALVPPEEALEAVDFRASRALATGGTLARYRILHFATHGLVNTAHPELSGLVLSLVDETGRPQDGFLRLQDIYNLRLSTDLVVLSACRSALGRRMAGEGLIGLTRGFMHAGAPRVVASLWQVDDSATAELMRRFYAGMLQERRRPAAALREAQRSMAAEPRWRAPYFWAGFTLEGEWR